jgi:Na+/proline symporter
MLYTYYGPLNLKSDEIFPKFIIEMIPAPYSGIIIAGLFAAAMSTLAGSISSLSSSSMMDLYKPFKGALKFDELKVSRMFTFFWAGMLILAAIFFMNSPQTVVELALSIASFTYGGLLGTFFLGLFNKKAKQEDALAGFTAGIFVMIAVISLNLVAWTWFTIIGMSVTLIVGSLLAKLSLAEEK